MNDIYKKPFNVGKYVKESLNEENSNTSFGKQRCMEFIKKYMPYLVKFNPSYINLDEEDRKNWKKLNTFDFISLEIPGTDGEEITMLITNDNGKPGIKFYHDSIAYNGYDSGAESGNSISVIPVSQFSEELFNSIVEDIKKEHNIS